MEKNMLASKGRRIIAVGNEAYDMFEKAPADIVVNSPMAFGMIANLELQEIVLYSMMRKIDKILGRVFSSSIMRTLCTCFGRGRSTACLSGSTAALDRPTARAVQKTNARPRKPPKMRKAKAAMTKTGVQISA